jgi:predicted permease
VRLDGEEIPMAMNAVGPGFFETMGLPIVAGRAIGPEDRAGAPAVVVINETAARRYFDGESPIGRRLTVGRRDVEIIGVAGAALYRNLRTPPQPMYYDSFAQRSFDNFPGLAALLRSAVPSPIHVVMRSSAAPGALVAAIPDAVREVAPGLPITEIRTHVEQIEGTIARERMFTRLLVIFGGFAVLLACIGLHGITTYAVARRTSEIGIRLALGAQRGQVLWLILRQVLVVATAGIALGVPIAIAAGPVVASLLFGLAPRDALTTAAAAAAMFVVALGAGWLPARRATGLDPARVLRES